MHTSYWDKILSLNWPGMIFCSSRKCWRCGTMSSHCVAMLSWWSYAWARNIDEKCYGPTPWRKQDQGFHRSGWYITLLSIRHEFFDTGKDTSATWHGTHYSDHEVSIPGHWNFYLSSQRMQLVEIYWARERLSRPFHVKWLRSEDEWVG